MKPTKKGYGRSYGYPKTNLKKEIENKIKKDNKKARKLKEDLDKSINELHKK